MKTYLFASILIIVLSTFSACYFSKLKKTKVVDPTVQAEIEKNAIIDYAIANKLKVESTDSGIHYIISKKGNGEKPSASSKVKAHYKGTLLDGTKFDSSYDRGEPLDFRLSQVIKGWQEAILLLDKGGKGTFLIPSDLAYGTRGAGGLIPANATLVFDIELVDFQ